nr:replication initiation protein [Sphingomonas oligoaromativorans]
MGRPIALRNELRIDIDTYLASVQNIPMSDEPTPGRTMKAASTAAVRDGHAIVKAGEFIEARFGAGASPSLAARKTLALLIAKAAGEAWKPGSHVIAKRELRGSHESNDRIQDTLDELMDIKFRMPSTSAQGRSATLTAALLAWTLNEHADDGLATVEWEFTAPARAVLQGSDYYARLNRAALLAFRSKYAITLYEMGCLLAGRREPRWSGTIEELRERLGVAPQTMLNFSDFRRFVLALAKAEIDQLAAFTMDWTEKRGARGKITHVTLCFSPKDDAATDAAAIELSRHSAGRKPRRSGTTETIVDPTALIAATTERMSVSDILRWPANDQITEFNAPELHAIGLHHGGGHAVQRLADQYIRVRADQRRQLSGDALRSDWMKWVTGCAEKWGNS